MSRSSRSSLWRHRDFRLLWGGETISHVGAQVTLVALPLVAVSLLAATPFQMGLLTAAGMAAFLLVGLPAGAWLDRTRRRPVMLLADVVRAVLLISVPIAWWLDSLTFAHLVVVALLSGVATVFFDVGYQSYLPSLVGRELLVDGNSKLESTRSIAQVSGPAMAGGLVQVLGAATAIVVDAATYALSALALARIRTPEPEPERPATPDLAREIGEGMRFVLRHPLLRAITGATATFNLFGSMQAAVLILFFVRDLGLSAGVIGLLFGIGGIGGVIGALTASRVADRVGQARVIWLSVLVTTPFGLLLPLAEPGWSVLLVAVADLAIGYGVVVYNVAQLSFRQSICPDRLLGRMNASIRFIVWGTMPIGSLIGGVLAEWLGVRNALWIAMAGAIVAVLPVVLSPLRSMRDMPTEDVIRAADPSAPQEEKPVS